MLETYLEYYKNNYPACVGLSRVHGSVWFTVHADGTSRPCNRLWNLVPQRFITFDKKGIKLCI